MGERGGGCGTVFKMGRDGMESVLYSFAGGADGGRPFGTLILDSQGNLYGTTVEGGDLNCTVPGEPSGSGCGTVFEVTSAGKEKVLYAFTGQLDGSAPFSWTGLVRDSKGNLYGSTLDGGDFNYCKGAGCGTIFRVSPKGKLDVLHTFTGGSDGSEPFAGLSTDGKGTFFGTTSIGGLTSGSCPPDGCGVVFRLMVSN